MYDKFKNAVVDTKIFEVGDKGVHNGCRDAVMIKEGTGSLQGCARIRTIDPGGDIWVSCPLWKPISQSADDVMPTAVNL